MGGLRSQTNDTFSHKHILPIALKANECKIKPITQSNINSLSLSLRAHFTNHIQIENNQTLLARKTNGLKSISATSACTQYWCVVTISHSHYMMTERKGVLECEMYFMKSFCCISFFFFFGQSNKLTESNKGRERIGQFVDMSHSWQGIMQSNRQLQIADCITFHLAQKS